MTEENAAGHTARLLTNYSLSGVGQSGAKHCFVQIFTDLNKTADLWETGSALQQFNYREYPCILYAGQTNRLVLHSTQYTVHIQVVF